MNIEIQGTNSEVTSAAIQKVREEIVSLIGLLEKRGEFNGIDSKNPIDHLKKGGLLTLSQYGERVSLSGFKFANDEKNGLIKYETCGGNKHHIELDSKGWITITFEGNRGSCCETPEGLYGFHGLSETLNHLLKSVTDWTLMGYKTSQPDWGIQHWLAGEVKTGPKNLSEAEKLGFIEA